VSDQHPDHDAGGGPDGLGALPGIARIAAAAGWHATGWALQTSIRASARLLQAATSPAAAIDLAQDVNHAARTVVRDLIDLADLDQRLGDAGPAADVARRVADAVPMPSWGAPHSAARPEDGDGVAGRSLREEGEELLRKSRDVRYEADAHPAYERMLAELAPDEGRVLRLMLLDGPQPAVDVRTGGPLGLVKSRLIAPGLSMIGARAGCRYPARVPSYLNNLFRLGMIWFSRETLNDPLRYQVLEAQPDVLEAIHSVGQAKVVRRSIHLTPFGEDFCRVCLSPETAELDALPEHSAPPQAQPPPSSPVVEA
jgi:hypothetical protein